MAEDPVEAGVVGVVGPDDGDRQDADDGDEEPVGADGEVLGKREAQAADRKQGDHGGPAGFLGVRGGVHGRLGGGRGDGIHSGQFHDARRGRREQAKGRHSDSLESG